EILPRRADGARRAIVDRIGGDSQRRNGQAQLAKEEIDMISPDNGRRLFQISFSDVIVEEIRQLQRRASREGRGEEFLLALRAAVDHLQKDPNEFGDLSIA